MKQKRILIVRPDRIGDVVLSTPLPREIKKQFPDSFIAVLVKKYTEAIYQHNPYVNKILLVDDFPVESKNYFWSKVKEIRSYKFTHALMLLPDEKINYILFFAGIRKRIGVGYKFFQFITGAKGISRQKYIPLRHEADYSMDLARAIGIETNNFDVEIHLNKDEQVRVREIRNNLLGGKRYLVGVHSTSGNSAPNWKPGVYESLISVLDNEEEIKVVNTDYHVPNEIKLRQNIKLINEGNELRDTIINIAALDLLVSASTGPMHIAAALKVKTVSLFCPLTACSPKLWKPVGNKQKVILPPENYCSNFCPGDPKECSFGEEKGISVKTVFKNVSEMLDIK
ncbi:ADP-heptose:LPS heptosyltransferase II [bacterium BMS3Abin04]|nr:ADP-heptose:LPS heptosyltransferase II [bacterium BMS3Abin04]